MASAASIQAVRHLKESQSEGAFSSGQPHAAATSSSTQPPSVLLDERSIADKLYTKSERSLLDGDWDISSPKRPSLLGGEITVPDDELVEIVEDVELEHPATRKQDVASADANVVANGAGLLTMLRDSLPYWGSEGMESLHQAVRKALATLKLGEVNSVDVETSETALLLCAQYGASDLVESLVEKNADVNHRLLSGATALHYMTNKSTFSASAVSKLLEYGADPNIAEEHNGATPLHYAADSGHLETCQRLVQHGADASIKDYGGYDAAGYAQGAGHAECEQFLRDCTSTSLYQIEIPAAAKAEPDYVAAAKAKRKPSSKTAVDGELSKLQEARMALAQLESDRSRLETERQMTKLKLEAEEATSRMERAEARALAATHDSASLRAKLDMAQAAADKVASELRTAQLEASSALASSASTVAAATARADELERSRSRATATAESAAERAMAAELALALAKNEAEAAKRERSEAIEKAERDTAKARSAESALKAAVAAFEAKRDADLVAVENSRAETKVAAEAAAEHAAQIAVTAALGNGGTKFEEAEARARSAAERAAAAEAEREFARAEAATLRSAGAVSLEEVRAAHEAVRTQAERRADQADAACASARDEAARLRQRLQDREATADSDRRRLAERIDALQAQASQLSASVAAKTSEAAAADSRAERAEKQAASLVEQLSALARTSSADQKLQAVEQAAKNQIADLERARDEAIAEAQRVRQSEETSLAQQRVEAAVLSALESHDQTASQRIAGVIGDSVLSAFENVAARDGSSMEAQTEKLARRAAEMALAEAAKHEASSIRDELSKARDTIASLSSRAEIAEAARGQLDHALESLRSEVASAVAGERAARAELAAAKEAVHSATSSSVAEAASQREALSAARAAHKRADEELVTVQAALRRVEGDLAASREETRRLREETERALKRVEQDSEKRLARENIEALNAASEARRKSEEELAVMRRAANTARAEAETALARADELTARVATAERRAANAEAELEQMRRERDAATITLREKSDTSEAELAHLRSQVAASKAELASVANLMDNVRVLEQRNAQLDRDLSRESQLRKKLHNTIEDMKGKIRVICRVRPFSSKEIGEGNHAPAVVKDGQASVSVIPQKGDKKRFTFDHVFEGTTVANSQSKLFEDVRHLVTSAVDGEYCNLFCNWRDAPRRVQCLHICLWPDRQRCDPASPNNLADM